jgi:hypothetical protein
MTILEVDAPEVRELRLRAKRATKALEVMKEEARVTAQHPMLTLDLRLRNYAHTRLVAFLAATVLGGIATYTVTDYTPETDKVFKFYGKFNPCIFFDHYPANIVGLIFMGFMILAGLGYNIVLFLRLQTIGNLWVTCYLGLLICICTCMDICFVNIFSANLYHMDDDHAHRRLNHPEIRNEQGFTKEEVDTVADHTNWFVLWLLAQILICVVLLRVLRLLRRPRFTHVSRFSCSQSLR